MTLPAIVSHASTKANFLTLQNYIDFARQVIEFANGGLQAEIVCQNEQQYRFWQFGQAGHFNISRPLNANLLYGVDTSDTLSSQFLQVLASAKDLPEADVASRAVICNSIYTIQQMIGVALDALPAGETNRARKVNGDLFERFIQLLLRHLSIDCTGGTIRVPVILEGEEQFKMNYQHDLIIKAQDEVKAIGSVKTSSKDRIDKIFIDKFLFNRLTGTDTPHLAIFLNDVQRGKKTDHSYRVASTFLPGHFKGYTVKLNPLDGVYYCDLRPSMETDTLLSQHIKTIDHFFCSDLWMLVT